MWRNVTSDDGNQIHVIPLHDMVEHGETVDCVCGPDLEAIGEPAVLLVRHHSLDGREHHEDDQEDDEVEEGAVRIATELTLHPDGRYSANITFHSDDDLIRPTKLGLIQMAQDFLAVMEGEYREVETD